MEDKTQQIVDDIRDGAQYFEDVDPINRVRELWNWQAGYEDSDVEIRIGPNANLAGAIQAIEDSESWSIRFFGTMDSTVDDNMVSLALIYHEPTPDPEGTMFSSDLIDQIE